MKHNFVGELLSSYWDAWKPLNSPQAAQIDLGPDWQELGSADFTGDGTADVLFRNVNTHEVGFVDGATEGPVQVLGTMDDDWSVATLAGVPDGLLNFYRDQDVHGIANVVWHNAGTGAVSIWHVVDGHLQQTLDMPQGGYWGIAPAGATAGLGGSGAFPETPAVPLPDVPPGLPSGGGDTPPDLLDGLPAGAPGMAHGAQAPEDVAAAGPGNPSDIPGSSSHGGVLNPDASALTPADSETTQAVQTLALGPEWEELGTVDFNGDGVDDTLVRNSETHEVGFVAGGQGEDAPVEPLGTIEDGVRVAKLAAVPDDLLSFDNFSSIESLVHIAWENEATGAVSIWQVQNGHLEQTLEAPAGGYWGIAEPAAASNGDADAPVVPGSGLAGPGDWHLSGLA